MYSTYWYDLILFPFTSSNSTPLWRYLSSKFSFSMILKYGNALDFLISTDELVISSDPSLVQFWTLFKAGHGHLQIAMTSTASGFYHFHFPCFQLSHWFFWYFELFELFSIDLSQPYYMDQPINWQCVIFSSFVLLCFLHILFRFVTRLSIYADFPIF